MSLSRIQWFTWQKVYIIDSNEAFSSSKQHYRRRHLLSRTASIGDINTVIILQFHTVSQTDKLSKLKIIQIAQTLSRTI
jgi:hypothetical protein